MAYARSLPDGQRWFSKIGKLPFVPGEKLDEPGPLFYDALFQTPDAWDRCAVLNVAGMGWFSSDRTIRDYAREVWRVPIAATTSAAG